MKKLLGMLVLVLLTGCVSNDGVFSSSEPKVLTAQETARQAALAGHPGKGSFTYTWTEEVLGEDGKIYSKKGSALVTK